MKRYLLSICQPDGDPPPSVDMERVVRETTAVNEAMKAAGAWVFSEGLHAAETATVLRPRGDEVLTTEGPYVEGKEHVGGLCIIQVEDLDEALEWGRRTALATTLPIEVRPFQDGAGH